MALPAVLLKAKGALTKAGKAKQVADAANAASDGRLGETAKKALPAIGCASLGCLIIPLMLFIIIFSNVFGAIQIAVGDTGSSGGIASINASSYLEWATIVANDDTHGYSQCNRTGPDYDCSSLVWYALVNAGGFTAAQLGGYAFGTDSMPSTLKSAGFKEYKFTSIKDLQPGDILLRSGHTEIYYGDGKTVGAHISETGGICGKSGDQTGHEIDISNTGNEWSTYYRLER